MLDASEARRGHSSRGALRRLAQHGLVGIGAAEGQQEDDDDRGAEDERVDAAGELESSGRDERDPDQGDVGRTSARAAPRTSLLTSVAPTGTASGAGRGRSRASRSSSRTCSSASIASSFIAASTSWCENLARVKSAVRRSTARASSARSSEDAREVLVRGLRRVAWNAVRREHALEAGVRGDDRAARVGLGPQVVERLVEDDRELLSEVLVRAPASVRASFRDDVRDDRPRARARRRRRSEATRRSARTAARAPWLGVVGNGVRPGKAKSPSSSAGAGGSQFLKRHYVTAVKKPKQRESRDRPGRGCGPCASLARDRLPLREPVEKKHASGRPRRGARG